MPSETPSAAAAGTAAVPPTAGKRSKSSARADFSKVALSSLRKYKKAHRVRMKPTGSKQDLVEAVSKHFAALPPPDDESQLIESFATALKTHNERERKRRPRSPQK